MNLKQFDLLQYTNTVVETINQILNERNWTLKKLSDVSNISYDTLKKLMSGHTGCPTTYNLIKLSQALGVSIGYLLGLDRHLNIDYTKLPERACNLISEIANFETKLYNLNQLQGKTYIPVIVPTGCMGDEMLFDSFYADYIDVSSYEEEFGSSMMCGIKVTNKSLHPAYLKDDVLIIANDRSPAYGETGIFLKGRHVYIRKYEYGTPSVLKPVNGFGKDIVATDPSEWYVFGRVLTVIR